MTSAPASCAAARAPSTAEGGASEPTASGAELVEAPTATHESTAPHDAASSDAATSCPSGTGRAPDHCATPPTALPST